MTSLDTATPTTTTTAALTRTRPRIIAVAIAVAVVANTGLWLAGLAAGGDFRFTDNGVEQIAAPGGALIFTALPMLAGLTVAALLGYLWAGFLRTAAWIGGTLSILTIGGTIAADFDVASTIALGAMHVALVFPLVWALERIRALALARVA
jgi:hypothetical protein